MFKKYALCYLDKRIAETKLDEEMWLKINPATNEPACKNLAFKAESIRKELEEIRSKFLTFEKDL